VPVRAVLAKEVAIPARAITQAGDVAELALTKHEIHDLPGVDVGHPESREPGHPRGSGLSYALRAMPHGIWGGTTWEGRVVMRMPLAEVNRKVTS
jgi:hypothetical protein